MKWTVEYILALFLQAIYPSHAKLREGNVSLWLWKHGVD